MPKMKTHKGASKRFKKTGSGKFKMSHANVNHILDKKTAKRKRHLRKTTIINSTDSKRMKLLLPY